MHFGVLPLGAPELQSVQLPPPGVLQCAASPSAKQLLPHLWKPPLQTNPHAPPEQIADPFAGTVQLRQLVPQWVASVFERQTPLQTWLPELQTTTERV